MPQPTSKARLVITALFVDHQTPADVATRYGVHRVNPPGMSGDPVC